MKEKTISVLNSRVIAALEFDCPECGEPVFISLYEAGKIDPEDDRDFAFAVCRDCGQHINIR